MDWSLVWFFMQVWISIFASVFDFHNYEECLMNSWFMVVVEEFDYSISEQFV